MVPEVSFATCNVAGCNHVVTAGTLLCGMHWMGLPSVLRNALRWDLAKGWDKEGPYQPLYRSHVALALHYYGGQPATWNTEE